MKQESKIQNRKSPIPPDPRHVSVREEIKRVYREENAGLDCPWSGRHAKVLAKTLATAQNWTAEHWHSCVLNRFASDGINPAQDPAEWIPRLASYQRQPLNRFGDTDRVPASCIEKQRRLATRYWETSGERSEEPEVGSQE